MKTTVTLPKRIRYPLSLGSRVARVRASNSIERLQIKKILVPMDFSSASHDALRFALRLLKQFNAELHLVHVAAPDAPLAGLAGMPIVLSETEFATRARMHLNRAANKCAVRLEQTNIHVLRGSPFEEICRLARQIDIDLIVIPTRGLSGWRHLALGSTAERVVRYSPCPVLVVRPAYRGERRDGKAPHPALAIKKIVVPVDFSGCSLKGLHYAKVLAKQFRAKLMLLHSVYFQYYVSSDEYARYDYPLLVQEADKAARVRMQELIREARAEGIEVEPLLKTGHAGEQICDNALSQDADLIVTSTHGWTGFKHVLLGSTAEYVVQHAKCPVLVVPTHERMPLKAK